MKTPRRATRVRVRVVRVRPLGRNGSGAEMPWRVHTGMVVAAVAAAVRKQKDRPKRRVEAAVAAMVVVVAVAVLLTP